ncbi:MAG: xanthine dehydrogenase, molybdenum binding subunit apoprotein [Firmicutes bacterium]|nr:xanthine dehydrogenase, molybdenum binding subunit apoprotein [Bacillota bacterium]
MRYIGERIPRVEDERLLTGRGQFVDDIPLPGALEGAVLRSEHAHARIVALDAGPALALPGVLAVITAADLGPALRPFPVMQQHPGLAACYNMAALADGVVRYVGEPIAFVVADNRYVAEDALELITVEYEALPAVASLEAALAPDAALVHAGAPGNLCGGFTQGAGDVDAALAAAPRILHQRLRIERGSAQPMETRAVAARYEDGQLTVWSSTQRPHRLRSIVAEFLGLAPEQVRAIAPDVGGAFGAKGNFYPEELLVPFAAMAIGRPVRWVEDRRENFLAMTQDRVQRFDITAGVDGDGRLLALKVECLHDLGAYAPYGFIPMVNIANHIIGPYKIPAIAVTLRGIYTHCTPTAAYRGAGRPQGVFAVERTMDLIARELGCDPAEVRRRNLIQPGEMPYDTGVSVGQSRLVYDSGDYPACQAAALAHLDYAGWRQEQGRLRAQGRLIGIGLANYIELASTEPFEGARLEATADGELIVRTGAGSQGQGHQTALAQIAAELLGLSLHQVRVEAGDTAGIAKGIGTFGSRTAILVGNAIRVAADQLRQQAIETAARLLWVSPQELEWHGGGVQRKDGGVQLMLAGLARAALDQGAPLAATHYFANPGLHTANGTHAAVVEVDGSTGVVRFRRYVVMHDCGIVINPLLADGQVYGGLAQALGGSLYERLVYDESGQLLTGSYMDYLLPTAAEMPDVELHHMESASPHTPLGVKGAGEGGSLPPYACIAAAIEDAIGVPVRALPLSPSQITALMRGEAMG